MPHASTLLSGSRRKWLQCTALAGMALAAPLRAQESPAARNARSATTTTITIAQVADMSPLQQDVSRDFLIGSRAAWQALNAAGGLQGRPVHHLVLETDGSAASLQAAWHKAHAHPGCVALSGCVGSATAASLAALQNRTGTSTPLAQIAPWLHSRPERLADDLVFDIFPGVRAQIAHALKTMLFTGLRDVGVVYGNAPLQQQSQAEITRVAQSMDLRTHTLAHGHPDRTTPPQAVVLFIGGTPELHAFTRQLLLPPGRQCYVVALADANLQVLAQLGGTPRNVSVIATQAVPLITSSLPVVRAYRQTLARLYDEPPSPLGLAGFIAARYTADTLARIDAAPTRTNVLAALRRRPDTDIGGFRVVFQGTQRTSAFVTQTMLTPDGRIIG